MMIQYAMPSAFLVAAGILMSRLAGLVRLRVFAHYFGLQSDAADAFNAAFRIPNFLQNLFGEGALSASFIPVYAELVARGERKEADRVAGAVASLLALLVSALVLLGMLATPSLISVIAPGFSGEKRELTIVLVRVLFPGAGLLVLSAWCLGVLNSHKKFLLSYAAPVMWNAAMIGTLVWFGGHGDLPRLAVMLAWGSVAGSALQLAVQLPAVWAAAPDLRFSLDTASAHVRLVAGSFAPVLISRGVVQISAYVDTVIASLLPTGAVTGLANAQLLYTLPVSLFGMSVAAAELPTLAAEAKADGSGGEALRARLDAGLRRIAFFVVPSAVAFLALGDVIAAALLQTGRFQREDAVYVWAILAGASLGLLPSTLGRLYSSGYYALRDPRTPLKFAVVRVLLTTVFGYLVAVRWGFGAPGLTASSGLVGWLEMALLRRALNARVGKTGLPLSYSAQLWGCAVAAAGSGWLMRGPASGLHPVPAAAAILIPFGLVYLGGTLALRVPEASATLKRLRRS